MTSSIPAMDSESGSYPVKPKGSPKYRFVILILCVFAFMLQYTTRTNINVAVVSMVNFEFKMNFSIMSDVCPPPFWKKYWRANNTRIIDHVSLTPNISHVPTYDWHPATQGHVLGAYYYGYVAVQIPVGRLVERVGGKWVAAVGILGSGLINIITPYIAESIEALIASRIILGVIQAGISPATFYYVVRWLPEHERSLGFGLINSSAYVGNMIACIAVGYIAASPDLGWPASFFILGGVNVVWTLVCWLTLIREAPKKKSNRISKSPTLDSLDCSDLNHNLPNGNLTKSTNQIIEVREESPPRKPPVPWCKILMNLPVWGTIVCRFAATFGFIMLQSRVPAYLEDVLHVTIENNGNANFIINAGPVITMCISPYLSEVIIKKGWFSVTTTRKLFTGIGQVLMALCIASIPSITKCDEDDVILILFMSMFFFGLVTGGDVICPAELSHHFGTTIYAIVNTLAHIAGFLAPLLCGIIIEGAIDSDDHKARWDIIFYLTALVVLLGTAFYLVVGSSERQEFDKIDDNEETPRNTSQVTTIKQID